VDYPLTLNLSEPARGQSTSASRGDAEQPLPRHLVTKKGSTVPEKSRLGIQDGSLFADVIGLVLSSEVGLGACKLAVVTCFLGVLVFMELEDVYFWVTGCDPAV
jgi:hypothetical protein